VSGGAVARLESASPSGSSMAVSCGCVVGDRPASTDRRRLGSLIAEPTDLLARVVVGALFVLLSLNLLAHFARTHEITGLLLLVSEALVVVLTIVRRRATFVDRSPATAVVAAISMMGPPLLRASTAPGLLPDAATASLSALGLSIVIAGKVVLGRSFGIVPANRGIVANGPYAFVRHPIYTGYLLTHVGFVLAHPQVANLALVVVSDVALIFRALNEERALQRDQRYREYIASVRWRLVPGII
jgi:protein-S-isoprenylcysteine O-methyltransferase Ste14